MDCGFAVVTAVVAGAKVVDVVVAFVVVTTLLPGRRISSFFAVLSVETETVVPSDVKIISPCRSVRYTSASASRRRLSTSSVGWP